MNKDDVKSLRLTAIGTATNVAGTFFPPIAILKGIYDESSGYIDRKHLNTRLQKIENTLKKILKNYPIDGISSTDEELNAKIASMDEHSYFTMRRSLKYILEEADTETIEALLSAWIEYISNQGDQHLMDEEVLEILADFNAHDINLMRLVGSFIQNSEQKEKNNLIEKLKNQQNSAGKWVDRNVILGSNTILWDDFADYIKIPKMDFGYLLVEPLQKKPLIAEEPNNNLTEDFSYLARSIVKLSNIGVLNVDYNLTTGNSSDRDINRFHVTMFGNEIIRHIERTDSLIERHD